MTPEEESKIKNELVKLGQLLGMAGSLAIKVQNYHEEFPSSEATEEMYRNAQEFIELRKKTKVTHSMAAAEGEEMFRKVKESQDSPG